MTEYSECCGAARSDQAPDRCAKCGEGTGFEADCEVCSEPCLVNGRPICNVVWDDENLVYHRDCAPDLT